jgi:hypothetical protein
MKSIFYAAPHFYKVGITVNQYRPNLNLPNNLANFIESIQYFSEIKHARGQTHLPHY